MPSQRQPICPASSALPPWQRLLPGAPLCVRVRLRPCLRVGLLLFLLLCLLLGGPAARAQSAAMIYQGKQLWQQRCSDCHALDTDETGPRHRGVFGRRAGSVAGYDYSRALRRSGVTWDAATLDRWLSNPETFIPGQNMDVRVRNARDRAAIIAYLQSLSAPSGAEVPAPVPVPGADNRQR